MDMVDVVGVVPSMMKELYPLPATVVVYQRVAKVSRVLSVVV